MCPPGMTSIDGEVQSKNARESDLSRCVRVIIRSSISDVHITALVIRVLNLRYGSHWDTHQSLL